MANQAGLNRPRQQQYCVKILFCSFVWLLVVRWWLLVYKVYFNENKTLQILAKKYS
jgi:hypothetical protein